MTVKDLLETTYDECPVILNIKNGNYAEVLFGRACKVFAWLDEFAGKKEVDEILVEDGKLKVWCSVDE